MKDQGQLLAGSPLAVTYLFVFEVISGFIYSALS
jgi:hypothetical protein